MQPKVSNEDQRELDKLQEADRIHAEKQMNLAAQLGQQRPASHKRLLFQLLVAHALVQ